MRMFPFCSDRAPVVIAAACLAVLASLTGCASNAPATETPLAAIAGNSGVQTTKQKRFLGVLSPYRIDIQQGNFASREMVAQLKEKMKSKEGMTADQVRFVMGTPLVTDIFHQDRWDYVFRFETDKGDIITSHISVFLKDNRLVSLEGGDLPTEKDYLALIASKTPIVSTGFSSKPSSQSQQP